MTTTSHVLHLNLSALGHGLRAALGDICAEVALGLTFAASAPAPKRSTLPTSWFQVGVGDLDAPPDVDKLRPRLETRLLVSGVRDCVELFLGFLGSVHSSLVIPRLILQPGVDVAEIGTELGRRQRQFASLGLPDKLSRLEALDLRLPPACSSMLLDLNRLRNCLVHRGGVVDSKDCAGAAALVVEWLQVSMLLNTPDGPVVATPPVTVEPGNSLDLCQEPVRRTFQQGAQVKLSAQEFSEIAWTFFAAGEDVIKATRDAIERFGVPLNGEVIWRPE